MQPGEPRIGADELLEHREFLRRIARGLVGDAQRADDVVQDAYVAALERPPSPSRTGGSVRGWLARVVRNLSLNALRRDDRRAVRERASARPEAIPSHETVLERIELSRRAVEGIQELPEVYRTAVYLRFYEGRAVGEIADVLGLPRETVKTRLRRGLEKLRCDLDVRTEGGRDVWMAALLPLAASPPLMPLPGPELAPATDVANLAPNGTAGTAGPVGVLGGVLAMKKLVLALGAGVVLVGGLFSLGIFEPGRPRGTEREVQPKQALAAPAAIPVDVHEAVAQTESALDRREVSEPHAMREEPVVLETATGAVTVEVVWESGGQVAEGVEVLAYPTALLEENDDVRRVTTDEDGRAHFDDLPPGEVELFGFRGGWGSAHVEAGRTSLASLTIPRGVDVQGVVLSPDGEPVAGASVWIRQPGFGWISGRRAATTDGSGRFFLRSVQLDRMIGARAEGYGPAIVEQLETRRVDPGEPVRLTLHLRGEGGTIDGVVRDPAGEPVAGARVVIGNSRQHGQKPDGTHGLLSPPISLVTGQDGRFEGLAIGAEYQQVFVRAAGFPVATQMVEVQADRTSSMVIELTQGATVTGTVGDMAGRPIEGATVSLAKTDGYVLSYSPFPPPVARTAADGRYVLDELPAGSLELFARPRVKAEGFARKELTVAGGETYEWSPELSRSVLIRGRLLSAVEEPVDGLFVAASAGEERAVARTEEDGLFTVAVLGDGPYTVTVAESASRLDDNLVVEEDVVPGGMLQLRLPPVPLDVATVIGRFEDAGARAGAQDRIRIQLRSTLRVEAEVEIEAGEFRLDDVTPGTYLLAVLAGGATILTAGPLDVPAGEALDLGLLATEVPGSLVVDVTVADSLDRPLRSVQVVAAERGKLGFHNLTFEGAGFRAAALEPGSYILMGMEPDAVLRADPFEILPGVETRIQAEVSGGAAREFEVILPDSGEASMIRIVIVSPEGRTVFDVSAPIPSQGGSFPFAQAFPRGTSKLVLETNAGHRAEAEISISDELEPQAATRELVLE